MKAVATFISICCTAIVLPAQIVINEVIPPNSVEIKNLGGSTVPVGTYNLCQFPNYDQLSNLTLQCGSLNLGAGEILTVTTSIINLSAADGELGLYINANNFGSSANITDYVEWGSSGHTRSSVAQGAGIWSAGDFVPAWTGCSSLEYDGSGNSSSDWVPTMNPSTCSENTFIACGGADCELTNAGLSNVDCDDNGTGGNSDDDIIIFSLNPQGSNTGTTYSVSVSSGSVNPTSAGYGGMTNFALQAGSAGSGNVIVTVTDDDDNNCTVMATITDPGTCSDACDLTSAGLSAVACNNNGTPLDETDDIITFTLDPAGVNLGTSYDVDVSVGTISPVNAAYGSPVSFALNAGSAGAGNVLLTITDNLDPGCMGEATVNDPGVCSGCDVEGGSISTSDMTDLCLSDETPDLVDVALSGASGMMMQWVITDDAGVILTLPVAPPFDFSGAGAGTCLIYHVSYEPGLNGLTVGANINDLEGCFAASNAITVERSEPIGGTLDTSDPTTICVTDGLPDLITPQVTGASGSSMAWVISDDAGVILDLPAAPPFDFEGTGGGTCLIRHLSYETGLTGLVVGNDVDALDGCYDLSEAITVVRMANGDCTSSVVDPELDRQLRVYPSVTDAHITIETQGISLSVVDLFTVQGQHVARWDGGAGLTSLLLSANPGMYLVRVRADQGIAVRKVIVVH